MKIRYKCAVTLDGVAVYFKRYAETPEQVITELTQFIKSLMTVHSILQMFSQIRHIL